MVWDFAGEILKRYNLKYSDHIRKEDITDWDIHKFLNPKCKNIFDEFVNEEFFLDLQVHSEIKTTMELIDEFADLYFITAGSSRTIPWRSALLKRSFGWFKDSQLVKLSDKSKFLCDYFVDDNLENCLLTSGKAYLIEQPWNDIDLSGSHIKRMSSLGALDEILREIFTNIKKGENE